MLDVDDQLAAADIDVDTGSGEAVELETPAKDPLTYVTERFIAVTDTRAGELDWGQVEELIGRSDGIPAAAGSRIKNAATSAAFQ